MRRLALTDDNLQEAIGQAVQVIRDGGLVVYPTETMYGVAADAENPEAVSRLLAFKNRPAGKAVSVLAADEAMASRYVDLNEEARSLYSTFLPGPLTVVSKSRGLADGRLESELGTLGIRISSHPVAAALVRAYGSALTATSANAAGSARPYSLEIMQSGLSPRQAALIGLALDAGELPRTEPSSVVDTTQTGQKIVRAGETFLDIAPPFASRSEEETRAYAAQLMGSLLHVLPERPLIFALEGEMGAGKTQFAKGVAQALGVTQVVTSPTYVLVKEYEGVSRLVHADLWRLTSVNPAELGFDEYLVPGTALVVEWAGEAIPYLRERGTGYHIIIDSPSEGERSITIAAL